MRFSSVAACLALCLLLPSAASAGIVTFDAFSTFNGTQGAGHFTYGGVAPMGGGGPFTNLTACPLDLQCLQSAAGSSGPGVYKSYGPPTPASAEGTSLPTDRLLMEPDQFGVVILFTAPTAGAWLISGAFNALSDAPSGYTVIRFGNIGGAAIPGANVGALTNSIANRSLATTFNLAQGDTIGFLIQPGSVHEDDLTGVNVSASTEVPEPATWALMLAGFGLTGAALRRRRSSAVRAAAA